MSKLIDFHFTEPDQSPGYLLWQVTMSWQRLLKKKLDPLEITHTQFVLLAALAWLSRTNSGVTQVDIARHSNTDRMMVSKVLRTLEKKSYVTRQEHPTDTRAKIISLTKKGQQLTQKAIRVVEQADVAFFAALKTQSKSFNVGLLKLVASNQNEH